MRTKIEWRSASRTNYVDFCRRHPSISLTFDEWRNIIYVFNDSFKEYILETGDKVKYPFGFGSFSINKKKQIKQRIINGQEIVTLSIDWKKTREKGKRIYNFNFHTDGYFFGWQWFKQTVRFKNPDLWYFKATRATSRLLAHYLKIDDKYQHVYRQWKV